MLPALNVISAGIRRRPATTGLALFLLGWYLLQLAVAATLGEATATQLFVATKPDHWPPDQLWPGLFLAPVSHSLDSLTHVTGNVAWIVILATLIEPDIGWKRVLSLVVGISYTATAISHLTAPLTKSWATVGVSGGVFALLAYTACMMWGHDWMDFEEPGLETVAALALLLGAPVVLVNELVLTRNAGHVFGLLLGVVYFRLDPP